jgi:PhnB protein
MTDYLPMEMNPYLSFKGDCEAAFKFYEEALGGEVGGIFRYAGTSLANQVPANWSNKVMHGSVKIGDQVLMGADVAPEQYAKPSGFSLSLHIKSTAEAERIFKALATGGSIVLPLEKTFWAALFGMVVDRFGVPWLINCEPPEDVL